MSIRTTPPPAPKPPIACAWGECNNLVPRGQEYSFIITLATRGADARAGSFQCPDIDDILTGNLDTQHFCCSMACAALCAHACIDEHLVPRHDAHISDLAQADAALAAEQAGMEAHRAELLAAQATTPLASGGVVNAPTIAMVAEPAPEIMPAPVAPDATQETPHEPETPSSDAAVHQTGDTTATATLSDAPAALAPTPDALVSQATTSAPDAGPPATDARDHPADQPSPDDHGGSGPSGEAVTVTGLSD